MELCLAGRLKPKYYWLSHVLGSCGAGGAVLIYTVTSVALCAQLHISWTDLQHGQWWAVLTLVLLILVLVGCKYSKQ